MKKLLSTILTGSLLLGLTAPALAAADTPAESPVSDAAEAPAEAAASGSLDARLTAVTRAVKAVLPIGDGFTEFTGEPNESATNPRWTLRWTGDSGSINVTAGEDGRVYYYNYYSSDEDSSRFWGLNAAFPKDNGAEALAAAQKFVDSLLGDKESVKLSQSDSRADGLSCTGTLLLNGLPSPVTIRVTLRTGDLLPIRFNRSDNYSETREEIPSPQSKTTAAKAAELLRGAMKLEARYMRDTGKGSEKAKTASLRFVRTDTADNIVTAADGKLVDLNKVLANLTATYNASASKASLGGSSSPAMAADEASADSGKAGGSARLTDAELKSIEGMKDVHSREQLDAAVRAIAGLGLTQAYTLDRVNYSRSDDGTVTAALTYNRPLTSAERADVQEGYEGELLQVTKNIEVDARTDELLSVYTGNYFLTRAGSRSAQTAAQRTAAEEFLAAQFPEKWENSASYPDSTEYRLRYAQRVNGYLFPENSITIRMGADGFVDSLTVSWDDDVTFASAEGVLSDEEAVRAFAAAYEMPLCYVEYPILENKTFAYKYVLAYALQQNTEGRSFLGVDAKTGEPVWRVYSEEQDYAYDDLDGCFGRAQIEALADYGIGLAGESFQPKAVLDQKTMLALLLSACGNTIDPSDEDGLDQLYSSAYSEGLIKSSERSPDAAVTRMTFLKTLLGASPYGEAAKVRGIYTCPFSDRAKVAEADLGYAALAYGLGIARGDEHSRLNPDSTMTRQEAAVMLYNFMMR